MRAFDLKEPWITHRRFEVFEDKHAELFGRPEVTADRIVLCEVILEAINDIIPKIENKLLGRYALTRYLLLYIVREILESDLLFSEITANPRRFVRDKTDREHFRDCIAQILVDVVIDLNGEIKDLETNFYYRDRLRDPTWVKEISRKVVADHSKLVIRQRIASFKDEWEANIVRPALPGSP